jgi:hypothetical protein
MFSVKDKDYFGMANQYAGDCFLAFEDIADISEDSGKIKQMHLPLTKPTNLSEYFNLKFPFDSKLSIIFPNQIWTPLMPWSIVKEINWPRNF